LRGIAPDAYTIGIQARGYVQSTQETVRVLPGRVVRSETIFLEANGSIAGVLVPTVAQARVLLKKDLRYVAEATVNSEDGSFLFSDVRPGEYEIKVRAEGLVCPEPPKKIQVTSGSVVKDTTFLKRPGSITGVVTPAEVGALVTVLCNGVQIARFAVRSDNGTFETSGLYPGQYTLTIRAQDYLDRAVENLDVREGLKLDVGVIELQSIKRTTPRARYLIGEGKRLHLSAEFEQAQAVFLEAITTQEMADRDLSEAYLWLAYSYFPFSELKSKEEEALRKSLQLDPSRVLDESFSPAFRRDFEAVKESVLRTPKD
ncbi:MAG: collagen binding domain-containing protein, partial [bacterium]